MRIEQLDIGADPARWADAGFAVADDVTTVGAVSLHFDRRSAGLGPPVALISRAGS